MRISEIIGESVEQGVAEGYNDISVGDYVIYDDGPGTDRWEVVSIEGNTVELRNDQGGTTFADINDVLKEQDLSETELGEAKRKRKKAKSKRRSSSSNRSPVPRYYGAWGFGGEGEGDGGGE